MYKYKIIDFLRFTNTDKVLNMYAKKGWKVVSHTVRISGLKNSRTCNESDPIYSFVLQKRGKK